MNLNVWVAAIIYLKPKKEEEEETSDLLLTVSIESHDRLKGHSCLAIKYCFIAILGNFAMNVR